MARFFIDRPIFAWVIAIIIVLAGVLSLTRLPISRYPTIAPPMVTINATYPGASAQAVENSVTQVIEQAMTGLDGMDYMSSTSDSNGAVTVTITFRIGTDPDIAQVQVQNKLQVANALLPQIVQQQGIRVTKASAGFLQVVAFVSEDGSMSRQDISDYVSANIVDPLSRVPGVGGVQVFGGKYAMRIWLDPGKLNGYRLAPSDVVAAIRAQNAQVAAGQLGGTPAIDGQEINATITAQDRLQTPDQFRAILLRTEPDGSTVRLGDVARVELGSEDYSVISRYNGEPASGLAISLATNANALSTADGVAALLERLKPDFPPGLRAVVPFDTTPFVRVSIKEVVKTLLEAVVLVFLVIFLFLQNFRATLIPTIAVPVVLLGTLGVLLALGFSINMLTMFAMVLAIGLLVDDAIVVVENVERIMSEEGLSPLEATRKSMDQITGALIGIALVLAAVFVPMAFLEGSTGVIYRQFTATIVAAMGLSVLIAIVLTPALCATMLKPLKKGEHVSENRFFVWFNRKFDQGNGKCQSMVRRILQRSGRFLLIYLALAVAMAFLYVRVPSSFLPDEDQGVLFTLVQTPVGATQQRTQRVMDQVEKYYLENEDGTRRVGVLGAGLQLRRPRPEQRHDVREVEGLGRTPERGSQHRSAGGPRNGQLQPDPRCHGVRARTAAGARTGADRWLQSVSEGQCRQRPRSVDRGAQPDARRGLPEQAAERRASERAGRHAAIPSGRRFREGRRARRAGGHDQRDGLHRMGRALHRRFHRSQSGQARLCAVGCDRSAWCRKTSPIGTHATTRAKWSRSRHSRHRTGATARRVSSATTACRR